MKLFQLENNKIIIDVETLLIPEFRTIFERDKTKSKEKAFAEYEYIYFISDWNSPYRNYIDIEERKAKVKKDYIKDKDWKEDDIIKDALVRYDELSKTPIMGLVEDAYVMVNKLRKYFLNADFDRVDRLGKRVDKSTEAMSNLGKLAEVVNSLKKLEEMAASEKFTKSTTKANRKTSYDER